MAYQTSFYLYLAVCCVLISQVFMKGHSADNGLAFRKKLRRRMQSAGGIPANQTEDPSCPTTKPWRWVRDNKCHRTQE